MAEQAQETGEDLRMMRADEVERLTGLSSVSIWRLEKAGKFPRRRKLMNNLVAWRSDEVQEWLESRPRAPLKGDDS